MHALMRIILSGQPTRGHSLYVLLSFYWISTSQDVLMGKLLESMYGENFLCEEGCLLTDHAAVATARAYE